MGIKINLTADEIKDAQGGFKPIPEGVYGATVYSAVYKLSKARKPMYEVEYLITEGPEVRKNFKIKSWYSLQPNALFGTIGLLKALDLPYPAKGTPAGEFEFPDAEELVNHSVNLRIILDPYTTEGDDGGEETAYRNQVKAVFPYDETKIDGPEDEDSATVKSGLFLS